RAALESLGDLGPEVLEIDVERRGGGKYPLPSVAVTLAGCLTDVDTGVRWHAAETLGRIRPDAEVTVPALRKSLIDVDVRLAAADALGWIGKDAEPAVEDLAKLSKDPDPEMRRVAAWSLLRIGKGTKAAVPVLVDDLKHPDWRLRRDAAAFLWQLGEEAR